MFILSTSLACSKEDPPIVVPGGSGGSGGSGSSSVSSVSLDNTSLSLRLGDSFTLSAYVSPPDASNKSVTWSSSNPSIASVSNGVVTGVSLGQAKITVTTVDGGKTATCDVTVFAPFPVTSVIFVNEAITIKEGDSYFLPTRIYPENASVKDLIWSSDNTSVATVVDGTVTAVSPGTARITVTTVDGGKTASTVVTVVKNSIPVGSVLLDKTEIILRNGEKALLNTVIEPDNATDKNVIWSSSDDSVATVKDGLITAINPGFATITVIAGGFEAYCTVVVNAIPVTGITLDKTFVKLKVGESVLLTATVSPENAYYKNVIWSEAGDSITIKDGLITAINPGEALINAVAGFIEGIGFIEASCRVIVEPILVDGITLDKTSATLKVGESVLLTATVNPKEATDKTVIWSSSNADMATVKDGVVKAIKPGNIIVSAKTKDGGYTATCRITVSAGGLNPTIDDWSEGKNYEGKTE